MSTCEERGSDSNLPVLAVRDWWFSEEEGDTIPFSPKPKPLIGATRELLLFIIVSCMANQSEAWLLGDFGV